MGLNALEKIVQSKRMPVLFIGSGISKRYLYKYPDWNELLELSYRKISKDTYPLQRERDKFSRDKLSQFKINAKLGTFIENEFNEAFFDRKIRLDRTKDPAWVRRGISPYKMFLSRYFKSMKMYSSPQKQEELVKFRALRNKVSAIITTNYDLFLEKEVFNTDFKVFVRQNELFSSDSYNIAEIYKIHGSASDANSIIITESDYNDFSDTRKLIVAKMLTLFAESPIVFLGYSFTDENIRTIIADFLGCLSQADLQNIEEHFVFVSWKEHEPSLIEVKRTIITETGAEIPITEIQTDNYSKVYDILNQIVPGMAPSRIRETRMLVKNIVDQSILSGSADSVIIGIDDISSLDLSSKPLAIAIGYKENILNKYGYGLLADDLIFEDILYDNKHFDANEMCLSRFHSLSCTRVIPVFKYVRGATAPINSNEKLARFISLHDTKEKIIPNNIKKQLKSVPVITDFDELALKMDAIDSINKRAGLLLKNIESFNIDQIREVCKKLFTLDRQASMESTNFKRCVEYLDFAENYTDAFRKQE